MNSYKVILKTTGLFAGLRVLSILVNVVTSKLIATVVGVNGIGLYGLLVNALNLLTTVSDFGISKSAVRSIAEADGSNDHQLIGKSISIISKLIYYLATIGAILTIISSYYLSIWTFGNSNYIISFVLLGIAVFFTNVKNGQVSILQGLRKYRLITFSTIYSSIIAFIFSIPLIYLFKEQGIIYVILLGAILTFIVTKFYFNRIDNDYFKNGVKLKFNDSADLIKLGLSMMLVSFLVTLSGYLIRTYIGKVGSLGDLGYFQAGFQIISGYFGIIFTSMSTDYFPRISAINDDNSKLETEVNQQATITLLLICPLVALLPIVMPYLISILYSKDFGPTVEYVNIALFGIIFQAGSQTMGMIMLAKNDAKVYTYSVLAFQIFFLFLNIVGYKYYGIFGLGVTFSINMFLHLVGIQILNFYLYKIVFKLDFLKIIIVVLLFALVANGLRYISSPYNFILGVVLFFLSLYFSLIKIKALLNIESITNLLKSRINGKSKKDN